MQVFGDMCSGGGEGVVPRLFHLPTHRAYLLHVCVSKLCLNCVNCAHAGLQRPQTGAKTVRKLCTQEQDQSTLYERCCCVFIRTCICMFVYMYANK